MHTLIQEKLQLQQLTLAYTDAAVNTGTSPLDTDDIPEGPIKSYYTDARADARATLRINAATTDNISEGTTTILYRC